MTPEPFGALSDGRPVRLARLGGPEGIAVEVLDFGATIHRLTVPTAAGPLAVTTGFPDLAGYEADHGYHGGLIGRCANRIGGARFAIDGVESVVSANEGANCLHGGAVGWNKRLWTFQESGEASDDEAIVLTYDSPDGEEGFPGAVRARATFSLPDPLTLEIAYEATSDKPTPVSLTHHLYFDLAGAPLFHPGASDARDHELTIAADAYTPVGPGLIPTGEVAPVAGTPFDFRIAQPFGARMGDPDPQLKPGGGYDHNWALTPAAAAAVRLRSPRSGVVLEVETDQPGLQVYGGQTMGPPFHPYAAVVLELQGWPDAVNRPTFPDPVLRPGQVYRRRTRYRFEAGPPGPA